MAIWRWPDNKRPKSKWQMANGQNDYHYQPTPIAHLIISKKRVGLGNKAARWQPARSGSIPFLKMGRDCKICLGLASGEVMHKWPESK